MSTCVARCELKKVDGRLPNRGAYPQLDDDYTCMDCGRPWRRDWKWGWSCGHAEDDIDVKPKWPDMVWSDEKRCWVEGPREPVVWAIGCYDSVTPEPKVTFAPA